jgi:hypothetical protein
MDLQHSRVGGNNVQFDSARCPNSSIQQLNQSTVEYYCLVITFNQPVTATPRPMSVMLETSLGELVIDLEIDRCPRTCENFLKLCKIKYYALNAFFNGTSTNSTFIMPSRGKQD